MADGPADAGGGSSAERVSDGDGYVALIAATALAPGKTRSLDLAGWRVLLCNVAGEFFAVEDRCSHANVALADGKLRGCILECPLHGGKFDVRDGSVKSPPPVRPLATFAVRVREGRVEVCRRARE
jgi:nitrite reductase/ring-hydroxylating ferredoxin subunit